VAIRSSDDLRDGKPRIIVAINGTAEQATEKVFLGRGKTTTGAEAGLILAAYAAPKGRSSTVDD